MHRVAGANPGLGVYALHVPQILVPAVLGGYLSTIGNCAHGASSLKVANPPEHFGGTQGGAATCHWNLKGKAR